MASETHFLASKVARRIFALFVLCALVPIAGLAAYSFGRVSNELYAQGEERLDNAVRDIGQGITQRLQLLDTELHLAAAGSDLEGTRAALEALQTVDATGTTRFLGIAIAERDGSITTLFGDIGDAPRPGPEQEAQLATGRSLLTAAPRVGEPPRVHLLRAVDPDDLEGPLVIGAINPTYLWTGAEDTLGDYQLCVLANPNMTLWCSRPPDGVLPPEVHAALASDVSGRLDWRIDDEPHLASFWSITLTYQFGVQWMVLLSESRAEILRPMEGFRYFFSLIVLTSLWVVLLLSMRQIRRSLVPLERLREGTRRIAEQHFETRVDVNSGDEFEELADSFNEMTARLGKQFHALATIADIDRAILSTLDIESIAHTVLRRTAELFDSHAVSITLISPDAHKVPRTYALRHTTGARPWVETTFFDKEDLRRFEKQPKVLEISAEEGAPNFLAPLSRSGCQSFVLFPMFIGEEPSGAIALGFDGEASCDEDDVRQARQLADQVAVALSNARLVEDLDALNWGALTALARAVDAKSPWTAGHSERVTQLGVKIGEKMGLKKDEIDVLHRGGLLHDIGKIGVPAAILDKPARLTPEEFEIMKKHPDIGATILQPISAYADVIPIVRQHHERWDGSGYPDGLAGRQIHRYARIYAVADVYDAVISDRPYRPGLSPDAVIRIIVDGDGTDFEPEVVAAFLEVMTDEGFGLMHAEGSSEAIG